mgnify:CR=1 FL=1
MQNFVHKIKISILFEHHKVSSINLKFYTTHLAKGSFSYNFQRFKVFYT